MDTREIDDLKLKIANGIRMLVEVDLLDMNGHLSYRIPGTDHVLINSRSASRAVITPDDIVMIDLDGKSLEGGVPPSEFHIHTATYRVRPEVNSVLHNHPHWQTVLGIAGQNMQPVYSVGGFIEENMPVHEVSSLIDTPEMGEEMAALWGTSPVMTIRHHGSVIAGASLEDVFARAVFVEENARKQFYAALLGPVKAMTGENLARTAATNWTPKIVQKIWIYYEGKARLEGKLVD